MDMSNRYTRKKRGNQDEDVQGVGRGGEEGKEAGGAPAEKKAGGAGRPPKIYTVKDIARILQFDYATIYRMHKSGKLPEPLSLGPSLRWNGWHIDEWMEAGCQLQKKAGIARKSAGKSKQNRAGSK